MLRKLLACLALLTGLAAAGAPAQAEVAVAMASRMEASSSVADSCGQAQAAPARPAVGGEFANERLAETIGEPALPGRAVRLRSDRARE